VFELGVNFSLWYGQRGAAALSSHQVREYHVSSTSSPPGDPNFSSVGLALRVCGGVGRVGGSAEF
jgi:hypothetical protein